MPFDYGFWGLLESGHLPGVKISGFKLNTASSDPAKAPNKDSGGRSYYAHRDQCHFHAAQSGPQATLASDKLGKEMDPDGAIWQLYQEESREHDKELIENRDKSLDVLLIYAGLFSSVLAGFLVDSKTLLQQDTETASMKLLLYIAQSQRAESNGSLSTPIELPSLSFTASNSARWINALWFLALFISLSTALITMLAKEWLQAYISSQPRSPHAHALLHQARLRGLYKWHALHIIDFLPSALHFSLLLFSIGIVIYLRELDYLVAALVATFIGFVFLFYVATTVFASCSMFCPFITQASRYIRQYLFKFPECATWADEQSKEAQGSEATTYHELRALFWLATFARDPAVGQCVYQALAGLRIPRVQKNTPPGAKEGKLSQLQNVDQGGEIDIYRSRSDLQHGQQEEDVSQRSPSRVESIQPSMVAKHTMVSQKHFDLLHKFFQATCAHLPTLLDTEERQISTRRCTSISKHANALPHLTALLNSCYVRPLPKRIPSWSFTNSGKLMGDDELGLPIFNDNQARESPTQIIKKALDSLDAVWGEHKSYITADSHSLLALAELRLTQALTTALVTENVNPEISADNTDRVTLFEPRARASRIS
ncbi:hypothetical protein RSOLAG1IB_12300 [Rhizoctonia solani AG-1 IB]|uniref:DUF6535 domain-containing protein n=1 Tax=Thanatephorus cucumeris (strain AG1-IB / isolate 7/3/14) TaxID=1108050 RepID=A0A0B7FTB3_THACB|nr:hypothetical protein RSOLAG1IB_12300 [Rhizoctonia solani AG-1 IB]